MEEKGEMKKRRKDRGRRVRQITTVTSELASRPLSSSVGRNGVCVHSLISIPGDFRINRTHTQMQNQFCARRKAGMKKFSFCMFALHLKLQRLILCESNLRHIC